MSKLKSFCIYPVDQDQTDIRQTSFLRLTQVFRYKYIVYKKNMYFKVIISLKQLSGYVQIFNLWLHADKFLEKASKHHIDLYIIYTGSSTNDPTFITKS